MNERPIIHPFCFGQKLWDSINSYVSGLAEHPSNEEKESLYMFFKSLEYLIPCNDCRSSYVVFNKEETTDISKIVSFTSVNQILELIYNLREKVNNKIGIEYGISLNYYKVKIYAIRNLCEKNMDHVMCSMYNAPFISDVMIDNVITYVRNNKQIDISNIKNNKKSIKEFMENITIDDLDFSNDMFKKMYNRNKKCLKIRDRIYSNILTHNYNFAKSFLIDNDYYVELFKECCFLFNNKVLHQLLTIDIIV